MLDSDIMCVGCLRHPDEIAEYAPKVTGEPMPAWRYVMREDGTYNRANGHFWCTSCYIKAGMPLGVAP